MNANAYSTPAGVGSFRLLFALILAISSVFVSAQSGPPVDFDIRGQRDLTLSAPPAALNPGQSQSLEALRHAHGGNLAVRWSRMTGAPSRISRPGSTLTPANNAPPQAIANAFLGRYRSLFNLSAQDIQEMRLSRDFVSRGNGITHLTLQQQINGLDVWGGGIKINIDPKGRVLNVSGEPISNLEASINASTPAINLSDAIALVARATAVDRPVEEQSLGLVYFPLAANDLRLAWRVQFKDADSPNLYDALVDALDGTVLVRKNLTQYDHFPAHGQVFLSDSPFPQTPKGTGSAASRQDVLFNGGDFFPHDDPHFDWWAGAARTTTTSNNVDAYADRDGDDAADGGSRPTAGAGEDFSFPLDLTQDPLNSQAAAVTNLFYWNNYIHDWLYLMGFDEAAGNFQTDNFGLGGAGGDAVMAEAQDNRDGAEPSLCNANFGTPADGNPPRMQMFQCDSANPERDGDFDVVVIAHEYGHGVHSRLLSTSGNQRGNEGWCDYFGLSIVAEPDDPYGGAYGVGDYLFNGNGDGIRSDPYSTDASVYKRTYADINDASTSCEIKTCSDDSTQMCTEDSDCTAPATCESLTGCKFHEDCKPPNTDIDQGSCRSQVHRTGELWANALWITRQNLIGKWGFAAGDPTMNWLVIDGMKLSAGDPTFLDGRDDILLADQVNNDGANRCLIWDGFARMGMGLSASTTDVLDLNPIEAFNVPADCAPVVKLTTETDFGALCEGDVAVHSLEVHNTGGGDLIVTGVERTSGSANITVDALPETPVFIGGGSHVGFSVRCAPSGPGDFSATITVTTNDTANPTRDVVFHCSAGTGDLQLAIADSGDFGNVCAGEHQDMSMTLFNQGACNLTIDDISVDDSNFLLPDDLEFPLVLSHDADFNLPIRFAPEQCGSGTIDATLTIDSDDEALSDLVGGPVHLIERVMFFDGFEDATAPGEAQRSRMAVGIDLSGSSTCPNLVIDSGIGGTTVFPTTVVDTTGTLGCFSERTVNLRNNGSCPLTIDDISAAGGDFQVIEPSVFPLLLPGGEETLAVTVRFAPQADADPLSPGEITGLLSVASDDPATPGTAPLCGESAAHAGVRILVTDVTGASPAPVAEVDSITVTSKGQNTPSPVNLRFTDQPVASAMICGSEVLYHVNQENLPETADGAGGNPQSSYEAKAKEGNLQAVDSFGLGQCELRDFQLQLVQ